MVTWSEMNQAVESARRDIKYGDIAIRWLAQLMKGRLRIARVGDNVLKSLKIELRDYNMHTGEWKGGE